MMGQNKIAMITGVTGQFGSYLAEYLVDKGYIVVGLYRRSSSNNFSRLKELKWYGYTNKNFILEEADLTDASSIDNLILKYRPDEFYNCAAQSHVHTSFSQPSTTLQINTLGVLNCLESIRKLSKHTKFLQMSTSEMFGNNFTQVGLKRFQDEKTELSPRSPYGVSKVAAHHLVKNYRESYGLFASTMIMYNCESPRRGENFVTKKIIKYVGHLYNSYLGHTSQKWMLDIFDNSVEKLKLGNLDAKRDWGYALDYVEAAHLILNHTIPDNFVICTGETHSIFDFLREAFIRIGVTDPMKYVEIDESLKRPSEVDYLCGSAEKARCILGWQPKIKFKDLVKIMIEAEINE